MVERDQKVAYSATVLKDILSELAGKVVDEWVEIGEDNMNGVDVMVRDNKLIYSAPAVKRILWDIYEYIYAKRVNIEKAEKTYIILNPGIIEEIAKAINQSASQPNSVG
jgi:hypothetical protein